jgi:hypothetical protein
MGAGKKRLARNALRRDSFDASRRAWRRPAIGVDEDLDETEGEAGPGVNRGESRRIPPLAK